MSEPTTYALPTEPEGPVWDKDGEMWERDTYLGAWDLVAGYLSRTWPMLLSDYGPLTTTPPWEPVVGGTVETREQYVAMPKGSIVAQDENEAWWLDAFGVWNSSVAGTDRSAPPSDGATILRVGWGS